jgi:hypothetical protein
MNLAQKLAIVVIRVRLQVLSAISYRKAAEYAFQLFCTPFRKSPKIYPPVFANAEKLEFEFESGIIRGHRWNQEAEKRILIVHGFESSSKSFERYVIPLIRKGYEVLAFDAPAHGASTGRRIDLPKYVRMLSVVHQRYGPIEAYLSHSFGGLVLSHFLEQHPHDENVKVVFIAPATETTSAIDSFFSYLGLSDFIRAEFERIIVERGGVPSSHYSIRRALQNIKASIVWYHDETDEMTPIEDALKVKEDNFPNVTFRVTQGLGHRKIYRDKGVQKQILEFL